MLQKILGIIVDKDFKGAKLAGIKKADIETGKVLQV